MSSQKSSAGLESRAPGEACAASVFARSKNPSQSNTTPTATAVGGSEQSPEPPALALPDVSCVKCRKVLANPPPVNERLERAHRLQEEATRRRLRIDDFILLNRETSIPEDYGVHDASQPPIAANAQHVASAISSSSSTTAKETSSNTTKSTAAAATGKSTSRPHRAAADATAARAAAGSTATTSPATGKSSSSSSSSPSSSSSSSSPSSLLPRKTPATSTTTATSSSSSSRREHKEDLDYFAAACKRELYAIALGSGDAESAYDQVDSVLVRPRVAPFEELNRLARQDSRGAVGSIPEDSLLCADCFDFCQSVLTREALESAEALLKIRSFDRERAYAQAQDTSPTPRDEQSFEDEVTSLLREQNKLMSEISEIESARAGVRMEQTKLDKADALLTEQEHKFWAEFGSLKELLQVVGEKTDSLTGRISRTMGVLSRLTPIHPFNDAFFVWRDGHYGIIDGFRLGHLVGTAAQQAAASPKIHPSATNRPPPDWEEINTAWGLSAMLLSAVAQTRKKEFKGFKIEPMGSRTTIVSLKSSPSALNFLSAGKTSYPLYLDVNKSASMLDRLKVVGGGTAVDSFNYAMRAFLICLKQLCDEAMLTKVGAKLDLATKMFDIMVPDESARQRGILPNSCLINGIPVDMTHAPFYSPGTTAPQIDVQYSLSWTKAMRRVVTNLKWLLVWCIYEKGCTTFRG